MQLKKLTVAAALVAGAATAGEIAPGDVVFTEDGAIEISLSGAPGVAANAPEIMDKGAGNCIACHQITALSDIPFHGEVGPSLDGAGSRWTEAELRGLVANAKMTFEGSVMPSFFKVDGFNRPGDAYTGNAAQEPLEPLLTAQQIEDVVAFLLMQKDQ
ncbi:sulfur oxidation c-type cytochrome SoxX [Sedimentitalea nanhaiensis]|uniref:Sulfur-oxidizing protein SoxX n=1 Tax=Sedimentitalea nanhaiensis TaxID=999627 RepID=A0A1I6ZCX0_9RHOB|nr:sulfur oxidation c-type cytochrome SoxX [Sedimentitalea nanhaiensis]SFT60539.1 sulfur-oxidizing protein SoxX [Sedimentitalea nanhaiensis]